MLTKTKDGALTGAQTATAVWTPASGKRVAFAGGVFKTQSASGKLTLFRGSNATGKRILYHTFDIDGGISFAIPCGPLLLEIDEVLYVTTTAGNLEYVLFGEEVGNAPQM